MSHHSIKQMLFMAHRAPSHYVTETRGSGTLSCTWQGRGHKPIFKLNQITVSIDAATQWLKYAHRDVGKK